MNCARQPAGAAPEAAEAGELTPRQLRRRLLTLARPVLAPIGLSVLFRTAALAAGIAMPALAGWAVTDVAWAFRRAVDSAPSVPIAVHAVPALIALAVLALVKGLARYLEQYCGHYVAFRVLARLRLYFYDRLAPQAPAAVEGRDTGDLLSRATKDVDRVEVFFAHTIAPAVTAVIVPIGTVVFAAVALRPLAAAPLAIGLALVGLATPRIGRRASAAGAQTVRRTRGQLAGHVRDSVQGVREVIGFGYQGRRLSEMDQAGAELAGGLRAIGRAVALRRGWNVAIMGLTLIVELEVLLFLYLDLGPMVGLGLGLSVGAFAPVLAVEDFAADLQQAYASARRIFAITDAAPLVQDLPAASTARPAVSTGDSMSAERSAGSRASMVSGMPGDPAPAERSAGARQSALRGRDRRETGEPWPGGGSAPEVRFEKVDFSYPNAARNSPALIDVSLTAAPGQVTAIVGASGSGKSTLAALLTRSWDPDSGAIYLGGRDLRAYQLDQVREAVAVSPQRPYLFNLPIEDNLRLARPGASAAELERAASAAHFDVVIRERDQGWQAPVGEMGELLSGGQRQRLALARTVLRDPPVLVLDEATSQLDPAAEAEVLRGLARAWRGKTVIVIAHRLTTVKDADRVYVMDAGRVVQSGAYADLAARPGPFADLLAREDG